MSLGCVGCHPSSARVSALEAGLSSPRKPGLIDDLEQGHYFRSHAAGGAA